MDEDKREKKKRGKVYCSCQNASEKPRRRRKWERGIGDYVNKMSEQNRKK